METKKIFDTFSTIKFLWPYAKKQRKRLILFFVGWLSDGIITMIVPIIFGLLIDEIVYYQNITIFLAISTSYLILLLMSCLICVIVYAYYQSLVTQFTHDLKLDIYNHWMDNEAQFLYNAKTGDIATMILSYSHESLAFMIRNVIHFANGVLKLSMLTCYMFLMNWKIGVVISLVAPITVYLSSMIGGKTNKYGTEANDKYASYIAWLYNILESIRDLRIIGVKEKVFTDLDRFQKDIYSVDEKTRKLNLGTNSALDLLNIVSMLFVFILTGNMAIDRLITVGELTVVLSLYSSLSSQISWTCSSYIDAQRRIAFVKRMHDFMNTNSELDRTGKKQLMVECGRIDFVGVSFAYIENNKILNDISFCIEASDKVALVGASGCGKTTLLNLLVGLFSPSDGQICIDGRSISEYTLESLRNNIGYVSQDVYLQNGKSIMENIRFGREDVSADKVEWACRKAKLWDDIQHLSEGVNTIIGINGVELSGGQKQRVALARMYIKNPKIIIIDEATSALDEYTEQCLFNEWTDLFENKTLIIVTHRKQLAQRCNKTIMLKNGSVCCYDDTAKLFAENAEIRGLFDCNKCK